MSAEKYNNYSTDFQNHGFRIIPVVNGFLVTPHNQPEVDPYVFEETSDLADFVKSAAANFTGKS